MGVFDNEVIRVRQRTFVGGAIILGIILVSGLATLANSAPISGFSVTTGENGSYSVLFDGSSSQDSDGSIVSYQWTFGDGFSGSGATKEHTYAHQGKYKVTLLVFDNESDYASITKTIDVFEASVAVDSPAGDGQGDEASYQRANVPTGLRGGQAAPLFTLPGFDGEQHSLSDYLGKVVILEFWRTTCPHCTASMPHLQDLATRYADQGVVVITVLVNHAWQNATSLFAKEGYSNFVSLYEPDGLDERPSDVYNVHGVPHTLLIDRYGVIRYTGSPERIYYTTIAAYL